MGMGDFPDLYTHKSCISHSVDTTKYDTSVHSDAYVARESCTHKKFNRNTLIQDQTL